MAKKSKKNPKRDIPLVDFTKFKGKQVALVEGKIVAEGRSSKEVFEKAKKLLSVPKKEIEVGC